VAGVSIVEITDYLVLKYCVHTSAGSVLCEFRV